MKGGKGGRKRKGRAIPTGKVPAPPPKAKNKSTHRSASVAPKKGSRKNTDFGWSSTKSDD
jgi:hypothetical protein